MLFYGNIFPKKANTLRLEIILKKTHICYFDANFQPWHINLGKNCELQSFERQHEDGLKEK